MVLVSSTSRVRRWPPVETVEDKTAAGSGQCCARSRIVRLQQDQPGDKTLGYSLMLGDVVLVQRRQTRVQ